jgi:hypothetical protein
MLDHSLAANKDQERGKECASALRIVLDEVLPVLTHAASPEHRAGSGLQETHDTPGQRSQWQGSTAQPGVAVSALSTDLPAVPAVSPSGHTINPLAAGVHTVPVESTLLLLGASAWLLRHCVVLANVDKDAYSTLSRSLHPATPLPFQDDLVSALDAVLALASDLVSGGPWWQQAKASYPLALIEALNDTSMVRKR